MFTLENKVIVITGAARGLGRAYAKACCEAGAFVVVADVLEDVGEATVAELTDANYQAEFQPLDLVDPKSINAVADTVGSRHGRIDGLVNNGALATGLGGKTFEELDIETWDRVMDINVRGTWLMTKACAPHLRKSRSGKVLNISSDTVLWGAPLLLHYLASKGAVISMTRALAREMGSDGIAVNVVAPGLTRVDATVNIPEGRHDQNEAGRAISRAEYPEDLTGAIVFFMSDASSFITGQILPVNGGFVFN